MLAQNEIHKNFKILTLLENISKIISFAVSVKLGRNMKSSYSYMSNGLKLKHSKARKQELLITREHVDIAFFPQRKS